MSFILYNKLALYLLQGVHGPRPPIPHEAEMHPDLQHIINGNRQKFMADAVGPMVRLLSILPSVFFFVRLKICTIPNRLVKLVRGFVNLCNLVLPLVLRVDSC